MKLEKNQAQQKSQYEQELWDRVAIVAKTVLADYGMENPEEISKISAEAADLVMAARAKRMQGA